MSASAKPDVPKATIQKIDDTSVTIMLDAGRVIYLVGPNGSGKSALISRITRQLKGTRFKRIAAHRQSWFPGDGATFAPTQRQQHELQQLQWDNSPESRHAESDPSTPIGLAIASIIAAENEWHRRVVAECERSEVPVKDYVARNPSPLQTLNEILGQGALAIRAVIAPGDMLHGVQENGDSVGVSRLSDGERSAILLAANVISAPAGTVFLIDEPERHLHHAITVPLLAALFRKREDCAFIISTHEIALPTANPDATSIILRGCTWAGDEPQAFDFEILEPRADIPVDLKAAVLGSRKRLLFVEGNDSTSLDAPLYAVLFPSVSVMAKETCREVIQAVDGLRSAAGLHWLDVFGLVDRDDRSEENVKNLEGRSIFALPVCSVEALYYGRVARKAMARQQAEALGKNEDDLFAACEAAAISSLNADVVANVCALRAERRAREEVFAHFPKKDVISSGKAEPVTFDVGKVFDEERAKFVGLLKENKLDELITRYQLRKSECYVRIAGALLFKNTALYEAAVVARVQRDGEFLAELKAEMKSLADAVCGPSA